MRPSFGFHVPVAGEGSIRAAELAAAGLTVSEDGEHLWVSDPVRSRVLRIRNPLADPVVDVVLGQLDLDGEECKRGASSPDPTSLCQPAHLSLDPQGNPFVWGHSLVAAPPCHFWTAHFLHIHLIIV